MAETEAIARMAEMLSEELFGVYGWKRTGPINCNWKCVNPDYHKKRKTHPSDVVYYYDHPYSGDRIYINTDLKSYAGSSIKAGQIATALNNLCHSVECCNSSMEWQNHYIHENVNPIINGLLFILNHDSNYGADFDSLLTKVAVDTKRLPRSSKTIVFGPRKIEILNTIANDIQRHLGKVRAEAHEFFYPDQSMVSKVLPEWKAAATLEMLASSIVVMKYKKSSDSKKFSLIIYYSRHGSTREEFVYLISYIFNYQLFQNADEVLVKIVGKVDPSAFSNFSKAKEKMSEEMNLGDDSEAFTKLKLESIGNVIPLYIENEIGMRDV